MTIFGKPFGYPRTKFCFAACPPETCDCGAYDPFCIDSHLYIGNETEKKLPIEVVPESKTNEGDK